MNQTVHTFVLLLQTNNEDMKAKFSPFPKKSILSTELNKLDYTDTYEMAFHDPNEQVTPIDAMKAFFSAAPKWLEKMMLLRDKIVAKIGLKTSEEYGLDRTETLNQFNGEVGQKIGQFEVFDKSDNEIIFGADDKHLNFRISILLTGSQNDYRKISLSTTVENHNLLGKFYFAIVKPFHKIIAAKMLEAMVKEINDNNVNPVRIVKKTNESVNKTIANLFFLTMS